MLKTISINAAREIIEMQNPVSIRFWDSKGEIIEADDVVCTSSYFHGNTFNFKFPNGEFRKVRAWNIFQLNGTEVCL